MTKNDPARRSMREIFEDMQDTLTDISVAVEKRRDALDDFLAAPETTIHRLDDVLDAFKAVESPDEV